MRQDGRGETAEGNHSAKTVELEPQSQSRRAGAKALEGLRWGGRAGACGAGRAQSNQSRSMKIKSPIF